MHQRRLKRLDNAQSKASDMVYLKQVSVETDKKDRYGRAVGKVLINGKDANLLQIERGMAWWYEAYKREQSADDQRLYEAAEDAAKAGMKGFWVDAEPVPLWGFWRQKTALISLSGD